MNESTHPLKSLVLDVLDLCQQTLALSEEGLSARDALAPLRASAEAIARELDALESLVDVESVEAIMPYEIDLDAAPSNDWLFAAEEAADGVTARKN